MAKVLNSKVLGIFLVAGCWVPQVAFSEVLKAEDVYAQVTPSVVTLKVENSYGERFTGSAFLALQKDVAVTAWHVVHDAVRVTAIFADGEQRAVTGLIDKNELHDLALIRLESSGRPLVKLMQTPPRVGSRAYVIGAPRGFGFSIVDGLLSQVQDVDGFPQYQVSCPFSTGNSGSPVLNERGEVIGVASWSKLKAQNLNFAVPASLIERLNPLQTPVPWTKLPQRESVFLVSKQAAPAADKTPEVRGELEAFRDAMKSSVGQRISIVVRRENGPEQTFSFVVPE